MATSAIVAVVAVAACGGPGGLEVVDAWGRSTPSVADTAAFYVTVENATSDDDRLVGSAGTERCQAIEVHRSGVVEGVMQMRPAEPAELAVPAGGTLVMEPGGLHVMCIGLRSPLVEGEEIPITFEFESAGTVEVTVTVEDR